MRAFEFLTEATEVDEMALPADWDPSQLGHDSSFKSRLEYAKRRAPRIGGGSSRVAFIIPDNGRNTVLKIAKNRKGIAQNKEEVKILTNPRVNERTNIVIPIVDYDKENSSPHWIQTELAQKIPRQQLYKMMRTPDLSFPITHALYLIGRTENDDVYRYIDQLSPEDKKIFNKYTDEIAELLASTSLGHGDLMRPENWGLYNGMPVVIDLGFTTDVAKLYKK